MPQLVPAQSVLIAQKMVTGTGLQADLQMFHRCLQVVFFVDLFRIAVELLNMLDSLTTVRDESLSQFRL
jgi:hypothetical protein